MLLYPRSPPVVRTCRQRNGTRTRVPIVMGRLFPSVIVRHQMWFEHEPIVASLVPADVHDLSDPAPPFEPGDVDDDVDRKGDGFADASMWQPDVRGQHAVREPSERLFGGVRMNRAEGSEVPRVESLQQVKCLGASHLT
jgi:hypothetical protein